MNLYLRTLTYLLVLAIGLAAGLGIALWIQTAAFSAESVWPASLPQVWL